MKVAAAASQTVKYLQEVRQEVRKVTWPGMEELRKSTLVIIIVVIIIGIIIGVMDAVFSKVLIDWLPRLFG